MFEQIQYDSRCRNTSELRTFSIFNVKSEITKNNQRFLLKNIFQELNCEIFVCDLKCYHSEDFHTYF